MINRWEYDNEEALYADDAMPQIRLGCASFSYVWIFMYDG